jgi:glutamine amidotransferase
VKVVIIKYNAGNIRSVDHALKRLGVHAEITDEHAAIIRADRVIFPGVGEAATTMAYLKERGLDRLIAGLGMPVLGICLGQQLMCRWSEEGDTPCIGIFAHPVIGFPAGGGDGKLKVPHMGWNSLSVLKGPLFKGIPDDSYVYFVHSYYVPACDETIATCDYIYPFSAALQKENFFATQFHPEKSGDAGQQILRNFLEL